MHTDREKTLHSDNFMVRHNYMFIRKHHTALERLVWESIQIKKSFKNKNIKTMNDKYEYSRSMLTDIEDDKNPEEERRY